MCSSRVWNAETVGESLTLARQLRAAGLRVEVYPDADKIGKQLKYASSRHARYAVIAGDDERAKGSVMVKDLTSGEQSEVPHGGAGRTGSAHDDRRAELSVRPTRIPQPTIYNG